MPVIENQRPGIYSTYTVDFSYNTPRSRQGAAVVMKGDGAMAGRLYRFTGYQNAEQELSGENNKALLSCVKCMLEYGVSPVLVSIVGGDYADALRLTGAEDNIGYVVCGCASDSEYDELKQYLAACASDQRERIAFIGFTDAVSAKKAAERLNNERIVTVCPGAGSDGDLLPGLSAAALAGRIASENDCTYNWNGEPLSLESCGSLSEEEIQELISSGVTVLENRGGQVRCIRAVTTRTKKDGITDYSMRSVNTVMIIDDVMRTVRDSLYTRLRGARSSARSIASQVVVELSAKLEQGVIESFTPPNVYSHVGDPTVCVVEIGFKVAQVLGQIYISAHVRI